VPTAKDRTHRRGLALTPRDDRILRAFHDHPVLDARLIELVFFPAGDQGRRSPSSCAHERLRRLWLDRYVDRIELPVAPSLGGRRPYLYTLGPRGVARVAARLGKGAAPVRSRRLDRVDDFFLDHDLKVAAFWAHLEALVRSVLVGRFVWVSERDLRARHTRVRDPKNGRWLPVLPDGLFELTYTNGAVQVALVEVDLGTTTLARFRRKIRAFELYLAEGRFAREWGRDSFEVVVLTCSSGRLRHLCEAARAEVPDDRWDAYLLATFDVLDPAKFGEWEWLTLWDDEVILLHEHAYPPEPDEASDLVRDADRESVRPGEPETGQLGPYPAGDRGDAEGR
jgi:protein involved in plasmid replication-relaxation